MKIKSLSIIALTIGLCVAGCVSGAADSLIYSDTRIDLADAVAQSETATGTDQKGDLIFMGGAVMSPSNMMTRRT